ncbi:MAG: pyruvate kinase [Microscillaceae bacterium]|nr:pyruvate kinase [Microscillaceae bacterium]
MTAFSKKTKIIATVGPACNTKEKLLELILAGTNVFRLNFSHGSHEEHLQVIQHIRALNKEHGFNVSILQDLQGPKIRIGDVENGSITLVPGKKIIITNEDVVGTPKKISTVYRALPTDVKVGDMILMDDGKISLKVLGTTANEVECEIIYGGELKSKKGINLPFTAISSPSLTEKDTEDLMFGLEHEVDWIALSFVRSHIDILLLKHLIRQKGKHCKVISKIEKPEAIENIDGIIAASDALMVARGDLGVEIGMEAVPMEQKMMVRKCKKAGKPVIIATQMMESMITSPKPTRAETNDVANAVLDGADTLMLSAETAVGQYGPLVVESMTKTILIAEERSKNIYHQNFDLDKNSPTFYNDSVIASAIYLVEDIGAKAVIGMTSSGYTAFRIASHRPQANIYIFTSNKQLLNQLSLVWGVTVFYYNKFESTDKTFEDLQKFLVDKGLLELGDRVINLASMPITKKKRTNVIKMSIVE